MNTNMTGFEWFSKVFASLCFRAKVASALEGLMNQLSGSLFLRCSGVEQINRNLCPSSSGVAQTGKGEHLLYADDHIACKMIWNVYETLQSNFSLNWATDIIGF